LAFALAGVIGLAGCAPLAPQPGDDSLTFMQAPLNAQGLVGSTPQVLSAEFGKPALLRVDGPAQVWLYHTSGCGLNLILYPDSSGTPRVALVTPTADSTAPQECTTTLQRAHVDAGLEHQTAS
jgi:hypothetical protein